MPYALCLVSCVLCLMPDTGDYKSGWELDRDWKLKEDKDKMDALQACPSKVVVKL
jgi:hypothetical protein